MRKNGVWIGAAVLAALFLMGRASKKRQEALEADRVHELPLPQRPSTAEAPDPTATGDRDGTLVAGDGTSVNRPIMVTAEELARAFRADVNAARAKFGKKILLVDGKVKKKSRGMRISSAQLEGVKGLDVNAVASTDAGDRTRLEAIADGVRGKFLCFVGGEEPEFPDLIVLDRCTLRWDLVQ